ncbi:MAG: TVP38/TMEM64 family protein [Corynebacterium sp.]|uniref:TVP38/TMEM64 family protein n=1 Tax=Corynebacterium sp. TaxID=1720 RepID=UPI0026DB29D9|nr:TVP38/TMEM64 family protein [Corynebacterium sp.]MDO5029063.1 TVP38/TMEM64 family protein [Corynebacterium sp.]
MKSSDVRITPTVKKVLLGLAVIVGVIVTLFVDVPTVATIRQWSIDAGDWFPIAYFLVYVALTQFPIPRTVFTLASGILFGPVLGFLLAITATTVSALVSLLIVRFLARDWFRTLLTNRRLIQLDHRLEQRGWLTVLSLRMIAGVPFSFLNYACGLSSIRVAPYIIATAIGSAPNTLAVVLLGDALLVGFDVRFAVATGILLLLGVAGLVLDAKFPVVEAPSKKLS